MAKLQKLTISGIRSFGPGENDVQHIRFNDSVTLFLGQNGTGKTTILETIKYALSSEIPGGCGKGEGFVNAPSLTGRMETKGQVRLKITDGNGKEIVIIKIVQVIQQKTNKLQFKSLDSTINERKPGQESVQFSGRCVDIDNYCAETLQVSKSILNNVLLCHQENSSWPLEEGKKLMEKFDEIFNSTRYKLCVDLLKKSYKEKKEQLKNLQLQLEYKKENKQRVEKTMVKLQDKKNESQLKQQNVDTKKGELVPIESRLLEIRSLEENFGKLEKDLASKEAVCKGLIAQQNTIRRNITTEFSGTDDELKTKIQTFESDRKNDEKMIKELENKKGEIENKEKETNAKVQNLQMRIGQLKEEKRQHKEKCIDRSTLIEKAKIQMQISCDITDYDVSDNAETVIGVLNDALEKFKETQDNKMLEIAGEEAALQNTIDEIKEKKIGIEQNIQVKIGIMNESEEKIKELTDRLHDLKVTSQRVESISSKIDEVDKTVASLKQSFNETEFATQITKGNSAIEEMENKKLSLEQEYRILQKNSVLLEKMESAKELIVQKQTEISKLKNKHSANLEKLFPQGLPTLLKPAVKSLLDKEEQNVRTLQSKINQKEKEVTTLDTKLQNQTERLCSLESDLQNKQKKVSSMCKNKKFDEVLATVQQKKASLHRDKAVCSSLQIVYEKFIAKFQEQDPCCPVCKTNFKNKSSMVQQIINEMRKEIEGVPLSLPKYDQQLSKVEELHNKLQQLKPVNDNIAVLSNVEMPLLKENLEEIKMSLASANEELKNLNEQIALPQQKVEMCKNLITDAAFIDQYHLDIEKSEEVCEDAESQLVTSSSGHSVQEIEAEIDTLNLDIVDLRKKLDSHNKKLEQHNVRMQDLRDKRSKLIENQLDFQGLVQAKPEKQKQLLEYKEKFAVIKIDLTELKGKLQLISSDLQEALQKNDNLKKENAKISDALRNKFTSYRKLIDDIVRLHESANQYLKENKNEILITTEEDLGKLRQLEENLSIAKNKISQAVSNKKEDLAKQDSKFRELQDNITLREKQKEQNLLDVEILKLKNQIGTHNLNTVHQEKRTLQLQYEKINREINIIIGQHDQLKDEISDLQQELNKPTNKNAYNEYRDKFYEMAIKTCGLNDLENYITVLEKAILEFHKDKMKQINQSIRELWRNIYRGNDIDYIEIKTDDASGSITRRSYNYRVVQVKRGAQLEMRGRCSAGQKVLACLVIRMALAEIFSSKCGILALDEPTTNLDRENICSLSDAISRIVIDRQRETNFQLLIITHDEDFLDTLTRVQSVANYYRVKRNEQGLSVVSKEHL